MGPRCRLSLMMIAIGACTACDGPLPLPAQPSPAIVQTVPPPTPQAPLGQLVTRAITVGEKVAGTLNAFDTWVIDVTAPETGVVAVRLTWDMSLTWMDLKWEERVFAGERLPQGEGRILVRMPVEAGRAYRLTILDAHHWENYGSGFVLETALE